MYYFTRTIAFVISFVIFLMGLSYLYWPKVVIKVNSMIRRILFNDVNVLLFRKKLGLIFILISVIIFYFAVNPPRRPGNSADNNIFMREVIRMKLYQAYRQYYTKDFETAAATVSFILSKAPGNIRALELAGMIHLAKGEKMNARAYFKRIIKRSPGNRKVEKLLQKTYEKE